jgi:small GTP-binding protein
MNLKKLLKKIFGGAKKVVVCGLDNAGKTTMVNYLKKGRFEDQYPTPGKEETAIEVEGVRMNIVDLGGQKDFRTLWLGEAKDADCVIFMVDASNLDRFPEARREMWKVSSVVKNLPLIVFSNKIDLDHASRSEVMDALDLSSLRSFEILEMSCKTGEGLEEAFIRIYYRITGEKLQRKGLLKLITICDQQGVPLATEKATSVKEDLADKSLAALSQFLKSLGDEAREINLGDDVMVVKRADRFLGSVVIESPDNLDIRDAKSGLVELLKTLEHDLESVEVSPDEMQQLLRARAEQLF